MINTEADWSIARHVTGILEGFVNDDWAISQFIAVLLDALAATPGFSEAFIVDESVSVAVSKEGFTLSGYGGYPEWFYPAPLGSKPLR